MTPASNKIVPKTRAGVSGIWAIAKATVESNASTPTICPAMTSEKTSAAPNFRMPINEAIK
jgi:hypothetical protein